MKKFLKVTVIIFLAAVCCMAFSACKKTAEPPPDGVYIYRDGLAPEQFVFYEGEEDYRLSFCWEISGDTAVRWAEGKEDYKANITEKDGKICFEGYKWQDGDGKDKGSEDVYEVIYDKDNKTITVNLIKKDESVKETISYATDEYNWLGISIVGINREINGTFVVPDMIEGKPVTRIGSSAFSGQTGLTRVIIPSTVAVIDGSAFRGCTSLHTVNSLKDVTTIGRGAFYGCSALEEAEISPELTSIGIGAFEGCTLLKEIELPASLTSLGGGAFAGCDNLNITVSKDNPNFVAEDNIIYNKDKTKIIACGNTAAEITVPGSVKNIGDYAFSENGNLVKITIYDIDILGDSAFANCAALKEIYIYDYTSPDIGSRSFSGCTLNIYVPYNELWAYDMIRESGVEITWQEVSVQFYNGETLYDTREVDYGAYIWEHDLPTPSKTGYVFCGWYDNSEFSGKPYVPDDVWDITEDISLYAKWSPAVNYITFSGYGSENFADMPVVYDQPIGALPVPERTGYTFLGWKDEYNKYYTADKIWRKGNGGVMLTSDWRVNAYKITYEANGGTPESAEETVNYGAVLDFLPAADKPGYTFIGWNTRADGGGEFIAAPYLYDFTEDITLYAQYSENLYSVMFDKQGGSGGSSGVNAVYGEDMTKASAPVRLGYAFFGYFTETGGNGVKYYNADMSSAAVWGVEEAEGGVTLYAHWQAEVYTVTLSGCGGSGGTGEISATYNSPMPAAVAPAREGYTFEGYYSEPNGRGIKYYNADMTSANVWIHVGSATIYANWTAATYTIILDQLGGRGGAYYVTVTYGSPMPSATAPSLYGYIFMGYYSEPGGQGTKYYNADMISAHNWDIAVTPEHASGLLYAYWQGIECVITFDFDGGYGGTTQITVRYGEEMPTEGLVFPERDGYKFGGYFLRPQWSVQQYYTGDFQSAQPWNRITDTTLYASWNRID